MPLLVHRSHDGICAGQISLCSGHDLPLGLRHFDHRARSARYPPKAWLFPLYATLLFILFKLFATHQLITFGLGFGATYTGDRRGSGWCWAHDSR